MKVRIPTLDLTAFQRRAIAHMMDEEYPITSKQLRIYLDRVVWDTIFEYVRVYRNHIRWTGKDSFKGTGA